MFELLKKDKLLFLLIILQVLVISQPVIGGNLDEFIRDRVQETDNIFIDNSMQIITHLGNGIVEVMIITTLPDSKAQSAAAKSLLLSAVTVQILKTVIGKKRPPGPIEYSPFILDNSYYSMPSGHTASAFALATVIADYYPEYKNMGYTLAALVGISRLYEDKHWVTDVIIGAGIGYLSGKAVLYKW